MKNYDHKKIEKKWQKEWDKNKIYKTENPGKKKKFYVLDMFPYPSGAGLHVGHPRGYIGSDVYARMKRMQGFNVLHPMGYDAFGLPAEQYAIENKIHPSKAVEKNIKTFRSQLDQIGFSYDWEKQVNTTDPSYYKWTQWIFLQIYNSYYDAKLNKARPISELIKKFEKTDKNWKNYKDIEKEKILMSHRLAYEGYAQVNWCPKLGTVLANDEIIENKDGSIVSERGGFPVLKKSMRQWFMRITAYADRLESDLKDLDWSLHIKEIQKNWIGRSEGSLIEFKVKSSKVDKEEGNKKPYKLDELPTISVFTTRADTLFGVTYLVISPEHENIGEFMVQSKNMAEVSAYVREAKERLKNDKTNDKEKTGIVLEGITATNPANGEHVQVWVGDYVLANYGTGAVMAVPAHDERDFEFAKKYNLEIKQSVMPIYGDSIKGEETRYAVSAFVKRPSDGKYLFIKAKEFGHISKVYGGIEKGESPGEAGVREVFEETGYKTKLVTDFGFSIQSHFYHPYKKVNRKLISDLVELELIDEEQYEVDEKEALLHEVVWLTLDQAKKLINNSKELHDFEILDGRKCFTDDGVTCNSGNFSGTSSETARKQITEFVGGKIVTKYKMRDAIFARQRYWGEPIPLQHGKDGTISMIKEKHLPLELPKVKSYEPIGTGESPLAGVSSWVKNGYETNTMPGWAGSSWYFLRYMDPKNNKQFASDKNIKYWKEVDVYVGGQEHATGHLLYSRFWHKFLFDMGYVPTKEPFKVLKNQGLIMASDGRKMSKRWGNVVNPDDVVSTYGADTLRVYEMFIGPFDQSVAWSTESIIGSRRFVERVYRLQEKIVSKYSKQNSIEKILHKTIKKVSCDIVSFNFNTSISAMMMFVNEVESFGEITSSDLKKFIQILAPFAPYVSEEIWANLKEHNSIHKSSWPVWDKNKIIDDEIKLVVQVNGKVRAQIVVSLDLSEEDIKKQALENENIIVWISGKEIKRIIYVKDRLINIVI